MKPRIEMVLYGGALIAAVGGAAWAIADRPPDPPPPQQEIELAQKPEPQEEPVLPAIVPDLPTVPDLEREPPPPRPVGDPRMSALGAEMRYLSRARELLDEHPTEALDLLEQHRAAHPDGVLAEEREAFAIEALLDLSRREEAERRYTDFLRRYPSSDFTTRLAQRMR